MTFEFVCSICLEESVSTENNLQKLSCNHIFHETCLNEWIKTCYNHKFTCPICRKKYKFNETNYLDTYVSDNSDTCMIFFMFIYIFLILFVLRNILN